MSYRKGGTRLVLGLLEHRSEFPDKVAVVSFGSDLNLFSTKTSVVFKPFSPGFPSFLLSYCNVPDRVYHFILVSSGLFCKQNFYN